MRRIFVQLYYAEVITTQNLFYYKDNTISRFCQEVLKEISHHTAAEIVKVKNHSETSSKGAKYSKIIYPITQTI